MPRRSGVAAELKAVERFVERYVTLARAGALPSLPSAPAIKALKGSRPRVLILDLLAWVALGQAHYGNPSAPAGTADALAAIRASTAAGDLVVPVAGMNLGEAMQRTDEASRRRLAQFMIELSGNCSFISEVQVAKEEFEPGIR